MQTYLFIGGDNDGMSIPAPSGTKTMQLPLDARRPCSCLACFLPCGVAARWP